MKATRGLAIAMVVAAGLTSRGILAQSPADAAVKEVRTAIDTARKEVDAYKTAGGAADAADHPAIKWDAAFWAYRERYPRSEAATVAAERCGSRLALASDRAHGARIPDDAPPDLERYSYQFYVGPSADMLSALIADCSIEVEKTVTETETESAPVQ